MRYNNRYYHMFCYTKTICFCYITIVVHYVLFSVFLFICMFKIYSASFEKSCQALCDERNELLIN